MTVAAIDDGAQDDVEIGRLEQLARRSSASARGRRAGELVDREEALGEEREERAEIDDAEPEQRRHEEEQRGRSRGARRARRRARREAVSRGGGRSSAAAVMAPRPSDGGPRAESGADRLRRRTSVARLPAPARAAVSRTPPQSATIAPARALVEHLDDRAVDADAARGVDAAGGARRRSSPAGGSRLRRAAPARGVAGSTTLEPPTKSATKRVRGRS